MIFSLLNFKRIKMSIGIVFHSGTGSTKLQAEAVLAGTGELGFIIEIDKEGNVPEDTFERLDAAKAIIFGSPTYMACCSWQFKKFAESCSSRWASGGWKNKYFAGFTNSLNINGDKAFTLDYFFHLAMQLGGLWVSFGTNPDASDRAKLIYLGHCVGAPAQTAWGASAPQPGDLETANFLGTIYFKFLLFSFK